MTYTIDNQKFGIEVEFGGISNRQAASVVGKQFDTTPNYNNEVIDRKGRVWKVVYDGSVNSQGGEAGELVSPPLTMEDMEDLQEIIRGLRRVGARVDNSCGIHVHVDLSNYSIKSLKNLIKYYAKYEDMFYKAAQVLPNRSRHYVKPLNQKHPQLVSKIGEVKTLDDLRKLWYNGDQTIFRKYDSSRYSGLNLHNIWLKGWYSGTVEFRLFNSTLHAGEIRSYVTLVLAISAKSLNAKSVNSRKNQIVEDVHLFPKILGGLGIFSKDEKMKNVYKHLTKSMRAAQ